MKKLASKYLTALALFIAWISVVIAAPLQPRGAAQPTSAWIEFCSRLPWECQNDQREPLTVPSSRQFRVLLDQINRQVNSEILPVTDQDHYGNPDRWDYPADGRGDCEDIQLVKRQRLIQAGIPRRALQMTVVIDEKGQGHAVLTVHTDTDDLILDNKRNEVLPWHRTGYVFVKREGRHGQWEALGGVSGMRETPHG